MINTLIHQWDIEVTVGRIRDAFDELGLDYGDLEENTVKNLIGQRITEDMSNQIIEAMLEAAKSMLLDQVSPYEPEIEIYCNGADSRFDISENDRDIIQTVKETGLDWEYVAWLRKQIPYYKDFRGFIENDDIYNKALQYLMETETDLIWDEPDKNTDTEKLEEAYLVNPYNLDKVYLLGASGKCYTK